MDEVLRGRGAEGVGDVVAAFLAVEGAGPITGGVQGEGATGDGEAGAAVEDAD